MADRFSSPIRLMGIHCGQLSACVLCRRIATKGDRYHVLKIDVKARLNLILRQIQCNLPDFFFPPVPVTNQSCLLIQSLVSVVSAISILRSDRRLVDVAIVNWLGSVFEYTSTKRSWNDAQSETLPYGIGESIKVVTIVQLSSCSPGGGWGEL